MKIPEHVLGGDLIWWRESPALHTVVTLWGGVDDLGGLGLETSNEAALLFRLHDPSGKLRSSWTVMISPGRPVIVNSRSHSGTLQEGVLTVFSISGMHRPRKYQRLLSMVDWYSDRGDLVSLHSDHSISTRNSPIEFTEVVFLEAPKARNYLVLVNGAEAQKPSSVELHVQNHRGEVRHAVYFPEMAPFSLHKLFLNELFSNLDEFCDGKHATLDGKFDAKGVFSRPYVMTEGKHMAGYHGGNRYPWSGIPRFLYKALGSGEVNPMVAVHSRELTTTVNLLNSHGDLEEDFWVDARLFDETGKEIVCRKQWLLARRGDVSRGEIAELLGDARCTFRGHVALNFSEDDKPIYPRRLQALMEYRSPVSAARVMAWSDIWNARPAVRKVREELAGFFDVNNLYAEDYLGGPEVTYRCHYRIWCQPPIVSHISITNCGISKDYNQTVSYRIRLFNSRGESLVHQGVLPPHATDYAPVDRFFPSAQKFLASTGIGVASVESRADLAVMHLSHHQASGVFSAEHFLASVNYHQGKQYTCCGA